MRSLPVLAIPLVFILVPVSGANRSASTPPEDHRSGFLRERLGRRGREPIFPTASRNDLPLHGRNGWHPFDRRHGSDEAEEGDPGRVMHGGARSRVHQRNVSEDTLDWYAQDTSGNVWYFGEDTKELDSNGNVISTEGSWQAGVNGAQQGVIMEAHPKVGDRYQQEFCGWRRAGHGPGAWPQQEHVRHVRVFR
jgi:hypothetical protein